MNLSIRSGTLEDVDIYSRKNPTLARAHHYSKMEVIAVDVERENFQMINQNKLEEAAKLVFSMEN